MLNNRATDLIPIYDSLGNQINELKLKEEELQKINAENDFAYNDFSQTGKFNMKNFRPILKYIYKNKMYYIYLKDDSGEYYITDSASNANIPIYDLSKNADQGRLNMDYGIRIRQAMLEDRVKFKYYTQYDLFRNFTKIFNL